MSSSLLQLDHEVNIVAPLYRSPYEAYPFLSEPAQDLRCDFELRTDELASLTGLLRSLVPADAAGIAADLVWTCEMIYHLNPSLRTNFRLTDDEILHLKVLTQRLAEEHEPKGFVLPLGTTAACTAHLLRVRAKELVRFLYRCVEAGITVDTRAIDFANLLSGYFFLLALTLNGAAGFPEVPFVSRAYG